MLNEGLLFCCIEYHSHLKHEQLLRNNNKKQKRSQQSAFFQIQFPLISITVQCFLFCSLHWPHQLECNASMHNASNPLHAEGERWRDRDRSKKIMTTGTFLSLPGTG